MNGIVFRLGKSVRVAFKHYSTIIISIIPCIIVVSLVGVVLNILTAMPLVHGQTIASVSPIAADWGAFLQIFSTCGIMAIPVYVTWSTVRHFGGTELYGLFVGLTLIPAGVMSGLDYGSGLLLGTVEYWNLGIAEIPRAGFQGQMLVAIFAGALVVALERFLTRITPKLVYIFVVPLLSVTLTTLLVYLVVGPAARFLEQGLAGAVDVILNDESFKVVGGLFMGLTAIPMMTFGIHLALVSVQLQQITSLGSSSLWPIQVSAVLACGGAALAVFLFEKEKELHESAREGALVTLGLGTVEPALFGVCCREKAAMAGAIVAAGAAGFLGRLLGCCSTSFGVNGFFSFLNFPVEQWLRYGLMLSVATGGSFFLTAGMLWVKKRRNKGGEQ
ncbi:MAG: PTS transporter subunit EIIC [Lachnospiraceae bacterium]|nr:PTS transporter subunit EIIC [Lachnospiraceae bacterium]